VASDRWSVPALQEPSLLNRLFGKPAMTSPLSGEDLIRLSPGDFPHSRGLQSYRPLINQALIRGDRLFAFTWGHSDSPKYGYPCAAIAEIGPDGRVRATPFFEDFARFLDEKRRGISCRFASDGRHAILTPIYKTTDPWAGKQGLLDLEINELLIAEMPPGFSKFRIIDINGDRIWAELGQPDVKSTRIVGAHFGFAAQLLNGYRTPCDTPLEPPVVRFCSTTA